MTRTSERRRASSLWSSVVGLVEDVSVVVKRVGSLREDRDEKKRRFDRNVYVVLRRCCCCCCWVASAR